MNFADRLRQLIEDSNISQKTLAQNIKMSPSTLANYVQGSRCPDYDTLMAIAKYFNVTTDYLLGFQLEKANEHQEIMLVQIFRSLTDEQKELYLEQGKVFAKYNQKEKTAKSS